MYGSTLFLTHCLHSILHKSCRCHCWRESWQKLSAVVTTFLALISSLRISSVIYFNIANVAASTDIAKKLWGMVLLISDNFDFHNSWNVLWLLARASKYAKFSTILRRLLLYSVKLREKGKSLADVHAHGLVDRHSSVIMWLIASCGEVVSSSNRLLMCWSCY